MDYLSLLCFLSVLCLVLRATPGQDVEGPVNVEVQIWEEMVMITWEPPRDAPEDAKYLVQLKWDNDPRVNVTSCEATVLKQCEISDLITNYTSRYFVWVGLITLQGNCIWSKKKPFTMKESRLHRPIFSLAAKSGSISVKLQQKPNLVNIFKFGIMYTVSLRRKQDKNETIQVRDFRYDPFQIPSDIEEDIVFEGLPWGQEYCVDVKLESVSTATTSNITEHCIHLSPDKITVITVAVIVVFVAVVILAISGIFYFLYHRVKMPTTLIASGTKWQPLSIDQTPVETVISNGWLLSRTSPESKKGLSEDKMAILLEEEKRVSLDSGVSMVTNSTRGDDGGLVRQEQPQEDSGCGSLGSSAENENENGGSSCMLPLLEGRTNTVPRGEDSGLGLGFNNESAGNTEGEDTRLLPDTEVLIGDGYRSQSPSTVVVLPSTPETTVTQALPETDFDMAAPIVGYRPSQLIGLMATTIDNSILPVENTKRDLPFSNYLRKSHSLEATSLLDSLSLSRQNSQNLRETFIVSLPQFLLSEKGPDCGLKTVPLSLGDMELTFG